MTDKLILLYSFSWSWFPQDVPFPSLISPPVPWCLPQVVDKVSKSATTTTTSLFSLLSLLEARSCMYV